MKPEMVPQRSLQQVGSARSGEASSMAPDERSAAPPSPFVPRGRRPFEGGRAGRVLGGRYRIEALLGVGAMGEVYRALDLERGQPCAIKLVFPGAVRTLKAERRFRQEAEVVARLFHPNIVEVREFRTDSDGTLFLVMELLTGQDLYSVLARNGRMPLPRALEILRGVGAALQYAHDLGVVHRDIKPNNIFLCRRVLTNGNEVESVKVLDFGLAKLEDDSFVTGPGKPGAAAGEAPLTQGLVVGTPAYLAPEATITGGRLVDARSDQWSLAVLAYEMLSGQLPFPEPNPHPLCLQIRKEPHIDLRTFVPDLPVHVYRAIDTALSKDQEQRFRKVQDFIRALDNLPPLGQSGTNHAIGLEAEGQRRARPSARQELLAPSVPPPVPRPVTSTPAFVAPERTTISAMALGVHLPSLAQDQPEALRTVQYSTEDLLALTQRAAGDGALLAWKAITINA